GVTDEARDLLRQLLAEISGNGNAPTPQVPAPPVAAVLRPSTWSHPPAPGEVIGDGAAPATGAHAGGAPGANARGAPGAHARGASAGAARGGGVDHVSLRDAAALDAFVRIVLARADEIRAGMLRFTLGGAASAGGVPPRGATSPSPAGAAGVVRVDRGALTERIVKQAADAGARLVLAPRAVITPLAREQARALAVRLERAR